MKMIKVKNCDTCPLLDDAIGSVPKYKEWFHCNALMKNILIKQGKCHPDCPLSDLPEQSDVVKLESKQTAREYLRLKIISKGGYVENGKVVNETIAGYNNVQKEIEWIAPLMEDWAKFYVPITDAQFAAELKERWPSELIIKTKCADLGTSLYTFNIEPVIIIAKWLKSELLKGGKP